MIFTGNCMQCGNAMEFTHEELGTAVTCPICRHEVSIPERPQIGRHYSGPVSPHHATILTTFAIIGLFLFPFAFAAWRMGASDLKEMEEGSMDDSGFKLTEQAYILGMIVSWIYIIGFFVGIAIGILN
jgi:hypothetical protein